MRVLFWIVSFQIRVHNSHFAGFGLRSDYVLYFSFFWEKRGFLIMQSFASSDFSLSFEYFLHDFVTEILIYTKAALEINFGSVSLPCLFADQCTCVIWSNFNESIIFLQFCLTFAYLPCDMCNVHVAVCAQKCSKLLFSEIYLFLYWREKAFWPSCKILTCMHGAGKLCELKALFVAFKCWSFFEYHILEF